jgi:predicted O-linked N-acetylglucosamine transferase (SPINDLY family)
VVFCAINQVFKIGPELFSVWMRLLAAVPGSILWLPEAEEIVKGNLRREAQARGVSPGRLVFAPRVPLARHLGRLAHADLFLDTFHYNAHTTALDALWAGVPVLTRAGTTMASRIAACFVTSLGLDELVVDSAEAYERKALELATNPGLLARVKQKLAAAKNDSPVFDTVARVRALERGFIAMVERHRAGLPPDTLVIE